MKNYAKEWADKYLNSEEGKKETKRLNKQALDYMIFGYPTKYLNEELLDDMNSFLRIEELSVEEIIVRFGDLLTDKDIENLKRLRDETRR
ncbi:MAG TPA: hypothetical protein VLA48_03475 [Nitrososphaeraceae archaeon]|nr:hypothetical protein [Nitrososphaeraceae archaeon]